jgi:REP element-mobilizing transposase RayT
LKQDAVAQIVVDAVERGVALGYFQLDSYVIMANHVHLLVFPLIEPSRLLKSLKGFTAREANRILGRTGEPFWQRESYDHWVRDEAELSCIRKYIENNPVKAGIVERPEHFHWSSASVARSGDAARTSACATT